MCGSPSRPPSSSPVGPASPPGSLLRTASSAVLRRESVLRESAIGRVSVRLVLPLGAVLLPAFMCTTVIPLVVVMTRGFLGT